jgi:cytochrome c peroxidase
MLFAKYLLAFVAPWTAALLASGVCVAQPNASVLSPIETKAALSHGPWPPPPLADAGNAFSFNKDAVQLGRRLFFDKRLSKDGEMSCSTCHKPAKAFTDGMATFNGRNTPSLLNAAYERWYGWDGAADSIWSQSLRPLLAKHEMAATPESLQKRLMSNPSLTRDYRKVFSDKTETLDSSALAVNLSKAIGAFVATLVSQKSKFDLFREALVEGDSAKAATYPTEARRGFQIFVGKGQCNVCHVGPMFSNGEFGDTGIGFFVRPGVVDSGRHGGIAELLASSHNLLSAQSTATELEKQKTRYVSAQHRNFGEFKVPSLRNAAKTAPYMHNGSIKTLEAVVAHYSNLNLDRLHADGEQILKPLNLTAQEQADLVSFLKTL